MKRPWVWLLICVAVLVITPFAVFPEIMGDIGPRNVPLWRNALGMALFAVAALGIAASLVSVLRVRKMRSASVK